jgi:hypothetical protein
MPCRLIIENRVTYFYHISKANWRCLARSIRDVCNTPDGNQQPARGKFPGEVIADKLTYLYFPDKSFPRRETQYGLKVGQPAVRDQLVCGRTATRERGRWTRSFAHQVPGAKHGLPFKCTCYEVTVFIKFILEDLCTFNLHQIQFIYARAWFMEVLLFLP